MSGDLSIGVDIGGTKIAAGVVDPTGRLLGEMLSIPTPVEGGPPAIVDAVVELAQKLRAGERGVRRIGIGSAGTFDADGRVLSATALLPGWAGTSLALLVSRRLSLPVVAINNVHATAKAESTLGAGRDAATLLVVALGTGIGGAIVRGGRLELGASGTAGSIGHVPVSGPALPCSCGADGHLEARASGPAIEAAYIRAGGDALSLRVITQRAVAGDPRALAVITGAGEALGEALAGAANLLDLSRIVVSGGVAALGDALLDPARIAFQRGALPGPRRASVVIGALGVTAPIVGAALHARGN